MKVRTLTVECFKTFFRYTLDLVDPTTGRAKDFCVLIGENGSGKTTLLQAIALPLALATRRIEFAHEFKWPGFILERMRSAWLPRASKITLVVEFHPDEIQATREFASSIPELADRPDYALPGSNETVTLTYENGALRAQEGQEAFFQFRGREYVKQLIRYNLQRHEAFERVGGVFWYDQERKASSLTFEKLNGAEPEAELAALRRRLADWRAFHLEIEYGQRKLQPGQRDYYGDLAAAFERIFAPRKFKGVESRPEIPAEPGGEDVWFVLTDGRHDYELAEMSSGEKAVFPMLYDFTHWRINRSVVLLDEVELHLHPPLQQFLLTVLPKLGNDNQLIVTTHSEEVLRVVPEGSVHRVWP